MGALPHGAESPLIWSQQWSWGPALWQALCSLAPRASACAMPSPGRPQAQGARMDRPHSVVGVGLRLPPREASPLRAPPGPGSSHWGWGACGCFSASPYPHARPAVGPQAGFGTWC